MTYDYDFCPDAVNDWDRVLIGDEQIHAGFVLCVRRLLRAGHSIEVTGGRVKVLPPIHPQVIEWLELDHDWVSTILRYAATAKPEHVH